GGCIRAAWNAEGDLITSNQLQPTDLVLQPWVGQGLELVYRLEVFGICDIIEQGNGRKLGVDQTIGLQALAFANRKVIQHHHWAALKASILLKVSYREIMSPWAMISNGVRPLKNSLWFSIEGKP